MADQIDLAATAVADGVAPSAASPAAPSPTPGTTAFPASPAAGATASREPQASPTDAAPPQWVRDRIREQTEKARAAEARYAQSEARLAERDRQIAALTGVQTPSPQAAEEEAILRALRPLLEKAYPQLARSVEEIEDERREVAATIQRQWDDHGQAAWDRMKALATEAYGGELTPQGQRLLKNAFAQELYMSDRADPESIYARYSRRDPTLFPEFIKLYLDEGFLQPHRRIVTAATMSRGNAIRSLPRTGQSAPIAQTTKPKPTDPDELFGEAFDVLAAGG